MSGAGLCFPGGARVGEGRKEDSETWGRPTGVSACQTAGNFEILKSLEEKCNHHGLSVSLLAVGAARGTCGEDGGASTGPSQGRAKRCGSRASGVPLVQPGPQQPPCAQGQGLELVHTVTPTQVFHGKKAASDKHERWTYR